MQEQRDEFRLSHAKSQVLVRHPCRKVASGSVIKRDQEPGFSKRQIGIRQMCLQGM